MNSDINININHLFKKNTDPMVVYIVKANRDQVYKLQNCEKMS